MNAKLIDISPAISPSIAVWPGDVSFKREETLSIESGSNIDLSSIHTTVHLGAHTDAPSHYVEAGEGIDERDLSFYYGEAQVMHVNVGQSERIRQSHLTGPIRAPRLLFRTGTYPDPDTFNSDFASISPALIEWLATEGVRMVGIDTPSIDPAESKDLPSHAMVAAHDLAILEGIVLEHVPDGIYTLIALPLRIVGADASPVRAILVDHS